MVDVLERLGCEIDFPERQTCCGQPAFNSGFRDEARDVAAYFLDVFRSAEYVVIPSGSCAAMIKHHYAELFAADAKLLLEANTMARKTYEFSQFLTAVLGVEDVGARFPHRVTYHDSCHALRELHAKHAPRKLLGQVRDLQLVEMDIAEECCGFGGTFSVKFPGVSAAMANTKVNSIERSGAEYVVSVDSSCLMNIEGTLRRRGHAARTIHLAEVLAHRE